MNNIGILKEFLEKTPYLYQKNRRAVIIDDYAVHGTSGDDASQERQAASFVYAYYAAAQADFIEAFIWHRIMDGAGEQCSLGLRQLDAQGKPVYDLFRVIDTQLGTKSAEPYAKIVGGRKWSSILKGFSRKQAETLKRYETTGEIAEKDAIKENAPVLLDFADRTLHGFVPGDYMASAEILSITAGTEINSSILFAMTHPMTAGQIASVAADVSARKLPQTAEVLYVTLKADAAAEAVPPADGETVAAPALPQQIRVQLHLYRDGEEDVRYLGETEIGIGAWTVAAFDIKEYARAASGMDVLRLSLIGGDGDPGVTYTLSVNDFRHETGAGLVVLRVFLTVLVILLLAVLFFAVLVIRAQIIRRRRRRQRAAQRAAYLARQRQMQASQMQAQQRKTQNPAQRQSQPTRNPMGQGQTSGSGARRAAQRRPDMYGQPNRYTDDDRNNRR